MPHEAVAPSREAVSPDEASAPAPIQATSVQATPMMAQYLRIKAAHPDCLLFYRMGDFYELFLDDAEIAARALNIVLTRRGKHLGEDIAMCGVPVDRATDYLHRLIAQGHRVAVCEQMEDPAEARKRGAKAVVERQVVRLVTPGTITEEGLLEPGRANVLLALVRVPASDGAPVFGFAALDISTGAFAVGEAPEGGLAALIARCEPSEVVLPDALLADTALSATLAEARVATTPVAREFADGALAERRLTDWFGVDTLDGFGAFSRAEIAAAACAVTYVTRTQVGRRPQLRPPQRLARGDTMEIDAATRANLELTRTLSGERAGSLLATINLCVTGAGGRLLGERIAAPLTDVARIRARQDAVAALLADHPLRGAARGVLKGAPDLLRALSRLALDRGGPRDLAAVRDALDAATRLAALLAGQAALPAELEDAVAALRRPDPGLRTLLDTALGDDLPLARREGRFVRPGFSPAIDEARVLRDNARAVIAQLQARYAVETGVKTLKVKHNAMLGFFVEVGQAAGEAWLRPPENARFTHRQTMTGAMRFSTSELAELEGRMASAASEVLAGELAVFADLAGAVAAEAPALRALADALALLDATAALAEVAATRDWVRPVVEDSLAFAVRGGRHPVVEVALRARGAGFVANDCDLSAPEVRRGRAAGGRLAVITGPNMAGKSTFLRQNAIIAILAQAGAFVPAAAATVGIVDRLFSRVGAADDLARGRSTFMVEMVEAAAILNQAGPRALVIMDELGRGTATFDGLSIAWAAVEHLHDRNRARVLFATHFHELTQLAKRLPRLTNLTMRVTDWNGEVVFLHEVVAGAADRSYGIQVARLAGLPEAAVERARLLLADLERSNRAAPVARLEDLPLFALREDGSPFAAALPTRDSLREALDALDPDALSPRAALEALYALKRLRMPE